MASQSEEKDLIGSILSDDEIKLMPSLCKKRKNLSLKSKEFNPEQLGNQQDIHTSNASLISTGQVSQQKQRIFFLTQTSIEIQSQFSSALIQTGEQEFTNSTDNFQSFDSLGKLQLKQKGKKHLTMQPLEYQHPQLQFQSDQCLDDKLQLSQLDLEQICGNQQINRKLQNALDGDDTIQKRIIFCQVEKICLKAAKDMFGNYTVQKIFDVADYDQKLKIYSLLIYHLLELSKNQYACRVVSKMIEFVKDFPEQIESFFYQIYPIIHQLLNDINGTYVLLSCFEILDKSTLLFMIPYIEECIPNLSKQTYGCRLIQKVLELYPLEINQRILDILISIAYQLCFQEFGNYIIQFLLKSGPQKEKQIICQIIKQNFELLCINKFGSNTVEKYIDIMGPSQIMKNICTKQNEQFVFYNLSIHPFGNYVMKKVLISGDPSVHYLKLLLKQNPDLIQQIKNSEFGQRVGLILDTL